MTPSRYRYRVLAVLCSLAFLTYLDRICIMRVQGDIERDLRLTELTAADEQLLRQRGQADDPQARTQLSRDRATERMSWIFSAFVAGYVLFEVPAGWLGDRWGARAVIFRIVLCWSLFTAATGGVKGIASIFSANPGPREWLVIMIVIRFLFGLGEAGAYPNIARALGRWFPFHERATAQSFIWLASRLGGAIAPAVIGALILLGGTWERAFWILGLAGIAWAIGFFLWFRDRPEDQPKVNAPERLLIQGREHGPGTIYDDSTNAARFRWMELLSPNVLALGLVSFCVSFCFYFYITFLPKYLKDQFQVEYAQSQFISGLPLLAGGLACLLGGFLSDYAIRKTGSRRWGRRLLPVVGWTAAGLCAFAVSQLHSATAVMALIVIAFAFQDLGVPSMWSLPTDIGGRFAGTVGGWMNTAGAVGGMLSPIVAAKVAIAHGWNATFLVFGAVYLLGAVAWLRVDAGQTIRPGH
ncbi:MAG TPA: MFS transporter [Verrucomicrobiae bacterium]|nr:MFS transporter [Verrucomicrobiae bacterium]